MSMRNAVPPRRWYMVYPRNFDAKTSGAVNLYKLYLRYKRYKLERGRTEGLYYLYRYAQE